MRFLDALLKSRANNKNIVIPDIKCFSPKEGDLLCGRNPVSIAKTLVAVAGAPVLSVVTEEKEFHGSLDILRAIRAGTDFDTDGGGIGVPILRKDFIETREELIETKAAGADAILLMYSCLGKERLSFLYHEALKLGLDPFVETHTKEEMEWALELGAKLVGINNRDILVLERDDGNVDNTCKMADMAPDDVFLISESSLMNHEDVSRAVGCGRRGADAALVGTALLKADDIVSFYKKLTRRTNVKICGIMDLDSIAVCENNNIDTLGFVVEYPKEVPWNLTAEKADFLMKNVGRDFHTAVVTGGSPDKVIALARTIKPYYLQLHYRETFEETVNICNAVADLGIKVIKTVPLKPEERLRQFRTDDIKKVAEMLNNSPVYGILTDRREPERLLENSDAPPVDEARLLKSLCDKKFVIMAGGITADNARAIISESDIYNIDIMTGVEVCTDTGIRKKSEEKVKALMQGLTYFDTGGRNK